MKKIKIFLLTALILSVSLSFSAAADSKKSGDTVKKVKLKRLPSNYVFYLPGLKNANDAKKDIEANGFTTSDTFSSHFAIKSASTGENFLKINTLDGKDEVFNIPLKGNEKKITVIFKAKGALVPDVNKPYGIFWTCWQFGENQAVLRHNASNQIKGSSGQTALNPEQIVSDWHEYRLVFDLSGDGKSVTATAFIDGKSRHKTSNFAKVFPEGKGNYFSFGEKDAGTNGFGRYPYILLVKNDDVSGKSLEDLSKVIGYDLTAVPSLESDPDPVSKKPAKKPETINLTQKDASSNDPKYVDPSLIINGTIDLTKLPYSKNAAQKVTAKPVLPANLAKIAAAVVEPTGANGAYKTIASAIEAVKPGSIIYIKPGMYQEKLKITKADLTLIGENPANTIIYGFEADTGNIGGNLLVEVNANGGGFNAENITFYNKGAEWNITWGNVERRAVCFATANVHKAYIKNCIFLGQQDTLYLRSGRQFFENCYIEGEVDFICGGATVLFSNSHIYSLNYKNGGYITAAAPSDTDKQEFNNGYVFRDCVFTADALMTAKNIFLGRGAWTGGSNGGANQAKVVIMNSQIGGYINANGWEDWDNINTAAKQFFREYKNTGDGAIKTDTDKRKLLTDAEYTANYSTTEKILGYKPKMPY